MQKDAILVKQTLAGNQQAFHQLIIEYQSDIYTLILSYVKNSDDAKELVQDVFFKAYCNLASLKQPERFYYWIRQIAKNDCQNWLERKRDFVALNDAIVVEAPPADEMLILQETLAKVMQAIDELPEIEKKILKERYLDESSYDELQARHGISYKALSMRLLRAKQKVRARIEKLLECISILSWHSTLRKTLPGGLKAVIIGEKVRIIVIGITATLIFGGIGVVVQHYHQPLQKKISDLSTNQLTQEISLPSNKGQASIKSNSAYNAYFNKSVEKQKDSEKNVKSKEQVTLSEELPTQNVEETEVKETPLQKYQRIWSSPEFRSEYTNAVAPYDDEYQNHVKESLILLQRKNELENELARASGEERDRIQKHLEKIKTDYNETRIQASMSMTMMMIESDRIILKYFTPDEFHEAIFQMEELQGRPVNLPHLPTKEESELVGSITFSPEEWSEAERRLSSRGINTRLMPMPSPALYEKYVLHKR